MFITMLGSFSVQVLGFTVSEISLFDDVRHSDQAHEPSPDAGTLRMRGSYGEHGSDID